MRLRQWINKLLCRRFYILDCLIVLQGKNMKKIIKIKSKIALATLIAMLMLGSVLANVHASENVNSYADVR